MTGQHCMQCSCQRPVLTQQAWQILHKYSNRVTCRWKYEVVVSQYPLIIISLYVWSYHRNVHVINEIASLWNSFWWTAKVLYLIPFVVYSICLHIHWSMEWHVGIIGHLQILPHKKGDIWNLQLVLSMINAKLVTMVMCHSNIHILSPWWWIIVTWIYCHHGDESVTCIYSHHGDPL